MNRRLTSGTKRWLWLLFLIVARPMSAQSPQKACETYEGRYIAYYDNVYRISGCKRYLLDSEQTFEVTRAQLGPVEVTADVIRAIPEGVGIATEKTRTCQDLEGKYISYSFGDVYWVTHCQKRRFPDWDSVDAHRKFQSLTPVTYKELMMIPAGREMPSVVDEDAATLLGREDKDLLPLHAVCDKWNGRFASYYSRVYRIMDCKKRLIDPDDLLRWEIRKLAGEESRTISELTSGEWQSIPLGAPYELPIPKRDEAPKPVFGGKKP